MLRSWEKKAEYPLVAFQSRGLKPRIPSKVFWKLEVEAHGFWVSSKGALKSA